MRFETLVAALMVLGSCGVARADLTDPPNFNAGEHRTIARNEMLSAIADVDPWLVRRILDLLAGRPGAKPGRARQPPVQVDGSKNPDLAHPGRTAESSVEWNELIKRAKLEKEGRGKGADLTRSSEGSVELIEMMRRAKAAKGAK